MSFRNIAPAGAPIRAGDLARATAIAVSPANVSERLRTVINERFGVRHSVLTSTGRAGMTLLLRALRRLAPGGRNEVIVPSYTCYSVAASAVKAGLRPRIVDISPRTLDYAPGELANTDFSRVLAIVATNLYGLPNNLPDVCHIARQHGVFVIDDAAQSMGASIGGRWSGTWGNAGLFSLDKGKPVSAIDGGIVVTNSDEVAAALDAEMAGMASPGLDRGGIDVLKALAYFVFLRPWLYGIPQRLPQLELGKTVFSTDYPLESPTRPLVALGLSAVEHLGEYTRIRVANATALLERLKTMPGVQAITPIAGAVPAYLRAPILICDGHARRRAFDALRAEGIGATGSYPASLVDVSELRPHLADPVPRAVGGRYVADHIVTLPTHPFVSAGDIERTLAVVAASVDRAAVTPAHGGHQEPSAVCAE